MRYFRNLQIKLSEDTLTEPKQVRFSEDISNEVDLVNLVDGGGDTKTYPIGTHDIDLSNISEGRWFFIKSSQEITISIDAGPSMTLIPNKASEMWMKFTSLSLTTTVESRITVATAGE